MFFLPTTLLFLSFTSTAQAATSTKVPPTNCSQGANRLQLGTFSFYSQCGAKEFCNSSGLCQARGCRQDEYPIGWSANDPNMPPMCQTGYFCPDEGDACQPLLPVGSACQLNRDDQCEPPSDVANLADTAGHGVNVNGSVCLNFQCMWANVTVGSSCAIENTPYTYYGPHVEYIDIVSRDNCLTGSYCDANKKVCLAAKNLAQSCAADKECASYNCLSNGTCGKDVHQPRQLAVWIYIVVGIGIFGGMFAMLISMFILHGKQREAEQEKRMQYWREQTAFRQNILQMRETARLSVLSHGQQSIGTVSARSSTLYPHRDREGSDDSHTPILQYSAGKSSNLRKPVMDEEDTGSTLGMPQAQVDYQQMGRF